MGHEDFWDENIFYYTGEGKKGDMKFIKGNKAILEHKENGKKLFLFEGYSKGKCKFKSEMVFQSFDYFITKDENNKNRNSIRFALKNIERKENNVVKEESKQYITKPTVTERNGLITSRVEQG